MTPVKTNKTLTAWRAAGAKILRRAVPYLLSYGASFAFIKAGTLFPTPNLALNAGVFVFGLTSLVIMAKMLWGFSKFVGDTFFNRLDRVALEDLKEMKRRNRLRALTGRDPQ